MTTEMNHNQPNYNYNPKFLEHTFSANTSQEQRTMANRQVL